MRKPEDVFKLDDFKAWVAEQSEDRAYDYTDPHQCALAFYLQARGVPEYMSCVDGWTFGSDVHKAVSAMPNTFGALKGRLAHV